jgi:hypothetical protein
MKKLIVLLLFVLPLTLGCEKILKTETARYDQAFTSTFSRSGTQTDVVTLTKAEVLKRLNLPDDARVLKVEIESLSFNVKLNSANQATDATFSGTVKTPNTAERDLFKDQKLTLSRFGILVGWTPLNGLIATGIELLKNQINEWVTTQISSVNSVTISITGVTNPPTSPMVLDYSLQIKASIQYEHCVSTGKLLGSEGIECEDLITK